MQNRKYSLIESLTNTFTGLMISFIIQIIIYPVMNIPVRLEQNIIITLVFTGASIGRGYVVRRIFNKFKNISQIENSTINLLRQMSKTTDD